MPVIFLQDKTRRRRKQAVSTVNFGCMAFWNFLYDPFITSAGPFVFVFSYFLIVATQVFSFSSIAASFASVDNGASLKAFSRKGKNTVFGLFWFTS